MKFGKRGVNLCAALQLRVRGWLLSRFHPGHLQPGSGIKAHGDRRSAGLPLHHRPLDNAGVGPHHSLSARGIARTGLHFSGQLAPSGALPVEQLFPAERLAPDGQAISGYTVFFEIVESVLQALGGQPGTGFFNGVAVGDTVERDHLTILTFFLDEKSFCGKFYGGCMLQK